MKNRKTADPMKTRNGRTRLKALSLTQLDALLAKAQRGRDRDKIQRRIRTLTQR